MYRAAKIVIAMVVVVLIIVIGWTIVDKDKADPSQQATAEPVAGAQTTPEAQAEATSAPDSSSPTPLELEATVEPETTDEAPEEMYEGALAGLTQEQIAELALAEEAASRELGDSGAEGAVD